MLDFLSRIFGPRFETWFGLVVLAVVAYGVAALSGVFRGWDARSGPFVLVTGFALSTFLLLIPFGYLVEHMKAAASLRFVGWFYSLYIVGGFGVLGYVAWQSGEKYFVGNVGIGEALASLGVGLFFTAFYTMFSIPLAIILAIVRKRDPDPTESE